MINKNRFTYCYLPSNSYLVNRDLLCWPTQCTECEARPDSHGVPNGLDRRHLDPWESMTLSHSCRLALHISAQWILVASQRDCCKLKFMRISTHWWHNLYEWEILRSIFPHSNKLFNAIFFRAHKCIIAIWNTKSFRLQFSLHPITLQATLTPDPTEQSPKQKTPPKSLILLPHPSQCNTSSQSAGRVYVNELNIVAEHITLQR